MENDYENFRKSLILGKLGEQAIIKLLESKGCSYMGSNNTNKFDFKMITKGKETSYEIKTDFRIAPIDDTGNLFVEFESRGKASGVTVTKSDWFVTYLIYFKEAWFIKPEKLKKLINDNNFDIAYDAGDVGSKTHGFLIKRKDFKEYFEIYKI